MKGQNGQYPRPKDSKPLIMRIIVLAVAAAMVVGIVIGAVAGMS